MKTILKTALLLGFIGFIGFTGLSQVAEAAQAIQASQASPTSPTNDPDWICGKFVIGSDQWGPVYTIELPSGSVGSVRDGFKYELLTESGGVVLTNLRKSI